jgi:hypothetical protein
VEGDEQTPVHATAMAQLTGWETTHLRHCSAADQRKRVGLWARMKFADSGARDELG